MGPDDLPVHTNCFRTMDVPLLSPCWRHGDDLLRRGSPGTCSLVLHAADGRQRGGYARTVRRGSVGTNGRASGGPLALRRSLAGSDPGEGRVRRGRGPPPCGGVDRVLRGAGFVRGRGPIDQRKIAAFARRKPWVQITLGTLAHITLRQGPRVP